VSTERRANMLNSNSRKLLLCGWLKENGNAEYNSTLKLQKFLFLYESFTKINGEKADFSYLEGYKLGPVFSNVWEDYTHKRADFDTAAQKEYNSFRKQINEEQAKRSLFIVSILSDKELADLTHKLNIWKAQESRIMQGEQQVVLYEKDFNDKDVEIMKLLEQMYPTPLIENSHIVKIDNHYFIFNKQDAKQLSEQHFDTLSDIANNQGLNNPVYIELSEEGNLIVD
jgi:hypothetical protein